MIPVDCAICGGALERELLNIAEPDRFERHLNIGRENYLRRWVECAQCGAASDVQLPENVALLESLAAGYYEVDFLNSSIAEKFARVEALPPELSDNAQRVSRVHGFMDRWLPAGFSARALDIGAGTGVFPWRFLDDARAHQWSATVLEPDPMAAEHLRGLGRFTVIEELFSSTLGLAGFDLVTLNKVVEHLPDPVLLVRSAATALAPDGVMYVEVPDRLTIDCRPPTDNILGPLHCHLYSPVSLSILMERAGLMILEIARILDPSGKLTITAFATPAGALERRAARRNVQ